MNTNNCIASLLQYGLEPGLIAACDTTYITNQLLQALSLDSYESAEPLNLHLEDILKGLLDEAVARGVCEDNITARDLCDTKLMGVLPYASI